MYRGNVRLFVYVRVSVPRRFHAARSQRATKSFTPPCNFVALDIVACYKVARWCKWVLRHLPLVPDRVNIRLIVVTVRVMKVKVMTSGSRWSLSLHIEL